MTETEAVSKLGQEWRRRISAYLVSQVKRMDLHPDISLWYDNGLLNFDELVSPTKANEFYCYGCYGKTEVMDGTPSLPHGWLRFDVTTAHGNELHQSRYEFCDECAEKTSLRVPDLTTVTFHAQLREGRYSERYNHKTI